MRPTVDVNGGGVYECYGCGNRTSDPDRAVCPLCGSEMRNLGRSRDL